MLKKIGLIASTCLLLGASSTVFAVSPTGYVMIAELNAMSQAEYEKSLIKLFERAPWVIAKTGQKRPHKGFTDMYMTMYNVIQKADKNAQLELLRSYGDLACQTVQAGAATTGGKEQASAGLNQCSQEETDELKQLMTDYRAKFGFSFVMAVGGFNKAEIFETIKKRLKNSKELELDNALQNSSKGLLLRLINAVK